MDRQTEQFDKGLELQPFTSSSNSAAKKNMVSETLTNGIQILD